MSTYMESWCWVHAGTQDGLETWCWCHTFLPALVSHLLSDMSFTGALGWVLIAMVTPVASRLFSAVIAVMFRVLCHTHWNLHHRGELFSLVLTNMHLCTWRLWMKTGKLCNVVENLFSGLDHCKTTFLNMRPCMVFYLRMHAYLCCIWFIFVLWSEVVSPCYRRWCNNLYEPLNPFPFLVGCWIKRRPGLRLIYRWPSYTV